MAVATAMPRPKTRSKVADNQRLKVIDDFWENSKVIRLWDTPSRNWDRLLREKICHRERTRGMSQSEFVSDTFATALNTTGNLAPTALVASFGETDATAIPSCFLH
jgi:hypothetical protein